MTRSSAVRAPFVRSAVRAEVRRAVRDGREVDRQYLRDETGLSWNRLERLIAAARIELNSTETAAPRSLPKKGGGGSAKGKGVVSPTNGPADPFALPTSKRKE